MAESTPEGRLTNSQVMLLGASISSENMWVIAEGYMDICKEVLQNIAFKNLKDQEGFTRDVIEKWKNKPQNSDHNQVKRLAALLYQAADEGGYVDPEKIRTILNVSRDELSLRKGPVTEKELNDLGEKLRPITVRRSNIDMIVWAENNKVKMEDLYTELKIDKLENKPIGVESSAVEDYKELFSQSTAVKGKRVLGKGNPGNGKTTFCKKVAWDWAKRIFTTFTLIFFVSMKLVLPGDPIENIIIQQTPELEGLKVTQQKLRDILNFFGNRCLVILDGFDEHISGGQNPNEDVMRMLKGQKFLFCNVFLTSRPHSVADLEQYFSTIVSIQGFTENHAREFAYRVLVDQDKIDPIMEIRCLKAGEYISRGNSVFTCPLLLLFVCVLVNGDEINLDRKEVTLGEIYTRLVRCLYRKYTVRKGRVFKQVEFVEVLRKVGIAAHLTLLNVRKVMQRSQLLRDVGEDIFDYGLLIGHEDFRLSADETGDIIISFVHRSIQEFLAALYYMLELDDRENRERLFDITFIQRNPLCLHFSLWFLGKHCTKEYFVIKNKGKIYECMEKRFISPMNVSRTYFPIEASFPAITLHAGITDELILEFVHKALPKCKRVRHLQLLKRDPIGSVMKALHPVLPQLSSIRLATRPILYAMSSEELHISIGTNPVSCVDELLAFCKGLDKPIAVHFTLKEVTDLGKYLVANVSALYIDGIAPSPKQSLSGLQNIPYSSYLTRITLSRQELNDGFALALSKAVEVGNLPNIRHLCFEHCKIVGKLPLLFQKKWPTLTHLDLLSYLYDIDIGCLLKTNVLFPSLTSLVLYLGHVHERVYLPMLKESAHEVRGDNKLRFNLRRHIALLDMFESPLLNITQLWMYDMNKHEYKRLVAAINRGTLQKLRELGICMWEQVDENKMVDIVKEQVDVDGVQCTITEQGSTLDWLPPVNAPTLINLTLQGFICTIQHLYMVTQSTVLTKLHELDISHSSGMTGTLSILLCHSFPSLNSLILSDCGLNFEDLYNLAQARAKGRLPELRHLDISRNKHFKGKLECLFPDGAHFENLCSLNANNASEYDFEYPHLIQHSRPHYRSRVEPPNKLIISEKSIRFFFQPGNRCWKNVEEIHIYSDLECQTKILYEIRDAVVQGLLPALKSLECADEKGKKEELIFCQSISHLLPNDVTKKVLEHINSTFKPAISKHCHELHLEKIQKMFSGEAMHEPSTDIPLKESARRVFATTKPALSVINRLDMSFLLSLAEDQGLTKPQTKQFIDAVRKYLTTHDIRVVKEADIRHERNKMFAKHGIEYPVLPYSSTVL